MTHKVINAVGNEHVLVDMEGRGQSLREHIDNIVIRVSTGLEVCTERVLPFLRGNLAAGMRRVKDKCLELQLTDIFYLRPHFEGEVSVGFV